MSYFSDVKYGDEVWSFEYGWGVVVSVYNLPSEFTIEVRFKNGGKAMYDENGKQDGFNNQTLFWDEVKFKVPPKSKIKLKEFNYEIDVNNNKIVSVNQDNLCDSMEKYSKQNGLCRNNIKIAKKALKQIKMFARLLALRDQECFDSKGYEFNIEERSTKSWIIYYDKHNKTWRTDLCLRYKPDHIYFKTEEDAQKICNILNEDRFNLEGE